MKKMNMMCAALAAILAVTMTGCGMNQTADTTAEHAVVTETQTESAAETEETAAETEAEATETEAAAEESAIEAVALSQSNNSDDAQDTDSELFTKRDLAQTADLNDAETITVADGKTIEMTCHFCNEKYYFTVPELKALRRWMDRQEE